MKKNFILRTQVDDNDFLDQIIGRSYTTSQIIGKTTEEWEKVVKRYFPLKQDCKDVRVLVIFDEVIPIYVNMKAWIMTENGSTFRKII